MYYVYIIKSLNHNWHYVGMTSNMDKRLKQHNRGKESTTRFYKPFKLIYSRPFDSRLEARDHEKYLKVSSNKEEILRTI